MKKIFAAALAALTIQFTSSVAAQWGSGDTTPAVVVARATMVDFPLTVEALGNARANESIDVRPKISETVTAIRFEEGQWVETGNVLVELQNAEALAAVAAAKAALVESDSQFRRSNELFKTKAVSASALEQIKAQRDADRAALDAAESRLADTVVKAPFAGRLGLRRVSLGSLVTPTTVITTLDDNQTIKLDFDVPETALAQVSKGLSIVARSAAYPEQRFEGIVSSVDTRVDPISRTITVRAQLPNDGGLLRPGMFMVVTLLKEDVQALMVPEQAIVPEQNQQFVFVVDGEGIVERREVKTGRRRPGQVEILSGLVAGEQVIVEGTQKARPGSPVQVVETQELTT